MIIWLASFPRSGNTLLRTVLYQCFGLFSYSAEKMLIDFTETAKELFGYRDLDTNWNTFYQQASISSNIYLVKTHRFPVDNQKAIYVVRDGRQALLSYYRYHQRFLGTDRLSLLQLVLGLDFYGGWSEHYTAWTENRPETLVVHFKDLIHGGTKILHDLAAFIGHNDWQKEWKNPFMLLHHENPAFFREGCAEWKPDELWDDFLDSIFFELHGDLMEALKYADRTEIDQSRTGISKELKGLLAIITSLLQRCRELQRVCDHRMDVIHDLKITCDERQTLIERLHHAMIKK